MTAKPNRITIRLTDSDYKAFKEKLDGRTMQFVIEKLIKMFLRGIR